MGRRLLRQPGARRQHGGEDPQARRVAPRQAVHLRRVRLQAHARAHRLRRSLRLGVWRRWPTRLRRHPGSLPAKAGRVPEGLAVHPDRGGRVPLHVHLRRARPVLHVGRRRLRQARPWRHDASAPASPPRVLPTVIPHVGLRRDLPFGERPLPSLSLAPSLSSARALRAPSRVCSPLNTPSLSGSRLALGRLAAPTAGSSSRGVAAPTASSGSRTR